MTRRKEPAPVPVPEVAAATAAAAAAFLAGQEITTTECRRCGTQVSGVNGRYACICGWVNDWSEGHTILPTADQDVDA
ncbi:hypothetical protein ACFQ0G_53950 [Streptomyces chiangmaiensis]|uniref:hypothetical protein n=1 Tax=Streptomyces chiangmaiensis TaxID=766497 RepID=UPI0031EAE297